MANGSTAYRNDATHGASASNPTSRALNSDRVSVYVVAVVTATIKLDMNFVADYIFKFTVPLLRYKKNIN